MLTVHSSTRKPVAHPVKGSCVHPYLPVGGAPAALAQPYAAYDDYAVHTYTCKQEMRSTLRRRRLTLPWTLSSTSSSSWPIFVSAPAVGRLHLPCTPHFTLTAPAQPHLRAMQARAILRKENKNSRNRGTSQRRSNWRFTLAQGSKAKHPTAGRRPLRRPKLSQTARFRRSARAPHVDCCVSPISMQHCVF